MPYSNLGTYFSTSCPPPPFFSLGMRRLRGAGTRLATAQIGRGQGPMLKWRFNIVAVSLATEQEQNLEHDLLHYRILVKPD